MSDDTRFQKAPKAKKEADPTWWLDNPKAMGLVKAAVFIVLLAIFVVLVVRQVARGAEKAKSVQFPDSAKVVWPYGSTAHKN